MFTIQESDQMFPEMSHLVPPQKCSITKEAPAEPLLA